MTKDKIVVTGCSISAHTRVTQNYCDFLSRKFNRQPLTLAGGGGSNKRWIRLLTEHILSGNITSKDLVILQFVESTRTELHSAHLSSMPSLQVDIPPERYTNLVNKFNDFYKNDVRHELDEGYEDTLVYTDKVLTHRPPPGSDSIEPVTNRYFYTNFKIHSHSYQMNEYDTTSHRNYENYNTVEALAVYDLYIQWVHLEALLEKYNINYFVYIETATEYIKKYLKSMGIDVWNQDTNFNLIETWPYFKSIKWHSPDNIYALDPANNDYSHYSLKGHQKVADFLSKHIIKHKLIDK